VSIALFDITPQRILYEDSELLAVDKPSGLVAHATVDRQRDHLVASLSRFLERRDGEVGHLAQHHRLDRDTSGVVLFGRNPKLDDALGRAFAERRVSKTYLAVVRADAARPFPEAETELRAYLATDRRSGNTRAVRSGGRVAITIVRALAHSGALTLVEARPITGRTHQIRVQLADFGYPIVGDERYGKRDDVRLLLHAASIELDHPRTGERLRIVAPTPREFEITRSRR
jgi:RluA family pseudouridine synthase